MGLILVYKCAIDNNNTFLDKSSQLELSDLKNNGKMTILGSCERNEAKTIWGIGRCVTTDDCKGARWCSGLGTCVG